MRYQIRHRTEYHYSQTVAVCKNQVRMQPRCLGGPVQRSEVMQRRNLEVPENAFHQLRCLRSAIQVQPKPTMVRSHIDYYGNPTYYFSVEYPHKSLKVEISSEVEIQVQDLDSETSIGWESIAARVPDCGNLSDFYACEFLHPSPRIDIDDAFRNYAKPSFATGRSIVEAAIDLTQRIHQDFKYDSKATDVLTKTSKAFELRAGVCQDFAHIQIACLRSMGVPARYVSGYLRTNPPEGKPKLVGADESHAWLSVYGGAELGWFDCDPTNACLVGMDHIPVCVGRDYSDVTPVRGVVYGGGKPAMRVSVDVEAVA